MATRRMTVQDFLKQLKRSAGDQEYFAATVQGRARYAALRLRQDKAIRSIYLKAARKVGAALKLAENADARARLLVQRKSLLLALQDVRNGMAGLLESDLAAAVADGSRGASGLLVAVAKKANLAGQFSEAGVQALTARVNRAAVEAIWSRTTADMTLSERIWKTSRRAVGAVRDVVRASVATGMDAVETARALDTYVSEGARTLAQQYPAMQERLSSTWPKGKTFQEAKAQGLLTPSSSRVPNDVCYEALRLARTEMSTALHEGTVSMAQACPGYSGMRWMLSSSHPEDDICDSYATADFGLGDGVFPVGDEPGCPAHPNCICSLIAEFEDDIDGFVDRLKGWVDDPGGDPELELWHRRVYRGLPEETAVKDIALTAAQRERAEKVGWIERAA